MFHVPIGNAKNTKMHAFDPHVPQIKYVQDAKSTCCLISPTSALFSVNEHFSEHAVVSQIS